MNILGLQGARHLFEHPEVCDPTTLKVMKDVVLELLLCTVLLTFLIAQVG